MRKMSLLVILAVFLLLVWTNSCQSPSSPGRPGASPVSQSNSNSNSNSGSGSGSAGASTGFLQVILKDAPIKEAKEIWVKINKIRVHQACETDDSCFVVVWEDATGLDLNLLKLKTDPITFTTALTAGKYNQIRMSVLSGQIVFGPPGAPVPTDLKYPLDVPSDEIKIPVQFEITTEGTTSITLDFDAEKSIHIVPKGKKDSYILRPVIHVEGITIN